MSTFACAVHRILTIVAVAASLLLGTFWLVLVRDASHAVVTLFVVLIVAALLLSWGVRWWALPRMARPVFRSPRAAVRVAAVTTFVPSHEPLDMLERSLVAMHGMHGAHDTWVLDESNSAAVRELCDRIGVYHFSRAGDLRYNQPSGSYRAKTKHGNYNSWCAHHGFAEYDVIAMFDPDHVPSPTYLQRTLGYLDDPRVAFVQPPQIYYNQAASFVARGAAEESYAYYSTHLMASYALGHAVVIGSHGVHRLAALRAVGGFPAHDAEDLYLTMLYSAAGWRGVFVPEVLAMGLTPVDWTSYARQQLRWARSLLDLKLRVFPSLAGGLGPMERVANLAHGAWFLRAAVLPVLYLLLGVALVTNSAPAFLRRDALLLLAGLVAVPLMLGRVHHRYYMAPDRVDRFHWRGAVMQFAKWPVLVRAMVEAVTGGQHAYALTSKRGGARSARLLAPVHATVALLIAGAWMVGTTHHGALYRPLTALAALVIGVSLAVAASDLLPLVNAGTADLYAERSDAMHRHSSRVGLHDACERREASR